MSASSLGSTQSANKRILFIGPLPDPITGQSLACQVFLDELSRHYQVDVVDLAKREFANGLSSLSRIGEVLGILKRVWRQRRGADAIYFTVSESSAGNAKDLLIYLLCRKRLRTMAVHLHGGAGLKQLMQGKRGPVRQVNEWFIRRLGAAIVLGQRHIDVFSGALPKDRIHIVPNFAEDFLFNNVVNIDKKFATVSPLRILFLSNLLPGKGASELVDAILALDDETRAGIRLDIAGGFESVGQQAAFLSRIASIREIHYHGTVRGEHKRQLLSDAHVFCLPTYYAYEGQPISILEAYASGCGVITTDHSGIGDIFTDGVNGYQVEPRSSHSLTTAIQRAKANANQLHQIALENRRCAELNYRTGTYTSNLLRVIRTLLAAESHQFVPRAGEPTKDLQ